MITIAEGFARRAGNARNRFEFAYGSLFEVQAAQSAAIAWRWISEQGIPSSVAACTLLADGAPWLDAALASEALLAGELA